MLQMTNIETVTVNIENIRSISPTASLLVHMRQQSGKELSWVTIVQGNPTQVQITPPEVPAKEY